MINLSFKMILNSLTDKCCLDATNCSVCFLKSKNSLKDNLFTKQSSLDIFQERSLNYNFEKFKESFPKNSDVLSIYIGL